ncbi:MAG: sigma-70 family RNA polymerase sigma factor [Planctomycetota bacterium]|nr:MAG: sigma-70 family RNA polymerase sigma factor [Planctomycetota bacterium]
MHATLSHSAPINPLRTNQEWPVSVDQHERQTDEAHWLRSYAQGDASALDRLVNTYQQPAFWVAYHLVRDEEVARDLVQEAFLKLLRKPQSYDGQRSFKAWFLRVVHNLGVDWLRRHRVRAHSDRMEDMDDVDSPSPDQRLHTKDLRGRVAEILRLMPEKYRSLLIMRDVEGLEPTAMAEAVDIAPGAMRFRIHYARKAFRKLWIEHFGEEVAP